MEHNLSKPDVECFTPSVFSKEQSNHFSLFNISVFSLLQQTAQTIKTQQTATRQHEIVSAFFLRLRVHAVEIDNFPPISVSKWY